MTSYSKLDLISLIRKTYEVENPIFEISIPNLYSLKSIKMTLFLKKCLNTLTADAGIPAKMAPSPVRGAGIPAQYNCI